MKKTRETWALKWREDGEWLAVVRTILVGLASDWSPDKRDRIEFGTRGSAQVMRDTVCDRPLDVVLVHITRRRA